MQYFSKEIQLDSDYFYRNIYSCCLLATSRVKSGNNILKFEQNITLNENSRKIVNKFIKDIEKNFGIIFSDSEREYIHFSIAENHPNLIDDKVIKSNQLLAEEVVSTIQNNLKSIINAEWILDPILEKNLLEHIKL